MSDAVAAAAGFLLIVQIWWIFFGAIHLLERAKRIQSGLLVLLSHLFLYIGIIFLANLTGHAINGDLNPQTFAVMGITGSGVLLSRQAAAVFIVQLSAAARADIRQHADLRRHHRARNLPAACRIFAADDVLRHVRLRPAQSGRWTLRQDVEAYAEAKEAD